MTDTAAQRRHKANEAQRREEGRRPLMVQRIRELETEKAQLLAENRRLRELLNGSRKEGSL